MTAPAGGRSAAPLIEVIIGTSHWWRKPKAASLIKKAIRTAAKEAGRDRSTARIGLAILLTDDSAIRALNRQWRKRNAPTNVLSFPANDTSMGRNTPRHLGDIVIAYQTTAREAAAEKKPFEHHLAHLAVHGYLHLLGYDHGTDRQAREMEGLEADILACLGVRDPYRPPNRTL